MGVTSLALKEWAVITRAMNRGEQMLLLRKGGIREQKKRFVLEGDEFLLYPSYEHQRRELLKPEYHRELEDTVATYQDNDNVEIVNLARVEEALEITEPEKVEALAPFYICTTDYAHYRLNWRPKKPLSVLLLRVFRLPQPNVLPVLPRYAGCLSWVDLEEAVDTTGASPILDDAAFSSSLKAIRESIGN